MADDLVASRHQTAHALCVRIRQPDLRQEIRRSQRGQHAGVNLVRFDAGIRDRLYLRRVGYDDPRHVRSEHPHHRHRVAGCLNDDLVFLGQAAPEVLQRRAGHVDPSCRTQSAVLPEHHLPEDTVDVYPDHTSHVCSLPIFLRRERWATRHLRIRARGATGQVAGAASY